MLKITSEQQHFHMTFKVFSLLQYNDESFYYNVPEMRLQLSEFKWVTDGGGFYCQVGNIVGTSSISLAANVTVESKFFF